MLKVRPLLIINLDEGSALLVLQMLRSLGDTAKLTLAAQSGLGPRGTETGGLETAAGSGVHVAPPR